MRTKILFGALSNGCSLEPTETPIMSSCHLHHGRTASGCRCTSSHQSCSERVWDRFHPGLETVGDHSQCDHHIPERCLYRARSHIIKSGRLWDLPIFNLYLGSLTHTNGVWGLGFGVWGLGFG